jgi:hopene-associated glycosyltransferase HpnB
MEQAVAYVRRVLPQPRYLWFTDADIEHEPMVLRGLVQRAERAKLDMVSTMVLLHAERFWERLLIPAFVFFFQKLYPFSYVNSPGRATAAAAGGSMLVNRSALAEAGGLTEIRNALIDDCALARLLKTKGRLWLGLTIHSRSIRAYGFGDIWRMVTRTAYRQLKYSPALLLSTVIGMALIYIAPIVVMVLSWTAGYILLAALGASTWMIMSVAYLPTVRLYKQPWLFALSLPVAAILYTLMTVDSARKHWLGKGGEWKGRLHQSKSGL